MSESAARAALLALDVAAWFAVDQEPMYATMIKL
jgi:hypothetical protein